MGPRTCAGCGEPLPPMRYQGNPRKWCSQACRVRTYYHGTGVKPDGSCQQCKAAFTPSRSDQRFCSKECGWKYRRPPSTTVVAPRTCQGCGEEFTPRPNNAERAKFCSMRCCRPYYNHIRRARLQAAFVEDVLPLVVFERDEWICHICGESVDRTVQYPDNASPTVDHVIPLSAGGEHSYANCRAAHMRCNSIKQARVKYPTRVP